MVAKAEPPPRPSVITNPDWLRKPSEDDLNKNYPDRAQRMEKTGRVSLNCQVKDDGTLENCSIGNENPTGYGFGEAAMKMVNLFKMRPQMKDGAPVGGAKVTIPIVFNLG